MKTILHALKSAWWWLVAQLETGWDFIFNWEKFHAEAREANGGRRICACCAQPGVQRLDLSKQRGAPVVECHNPYCDHHGLAWVVEEQL